MLSTALELAGFALLTIGVTAGTYVLLGLGFALLALGIVGGGVCLLVGWLIGDGPAPAKPVEVKTPRPLTSADLAEAS